MWICMCGLSRNQPFCDGSHKKIAGEEDGKTYEYDGFDPKWRAIYDDRGRVMVAMCFNQDDGDAWEHADNPAYEAKYTSQAYRLGINYVTYAMTH